MLTFILSLSFGRSERTKQFSLLWADTFILRQKGKDISDLETCMEYSGKNLLLWVNLYLVTFFDCVLLSIMNQKYTLSWENWNAEKNIYTILVGKLDIHSYLLLTLPDVLLQRIVVRC